MKILSGKLQPKRLLISLVLAPSLLWCSAAIAAGFDMKGGSAKAGADTSPEAAATAWNDVAATTASITSSNVVSQIQQLHDAMKNYQWRTVYEFGQVSKSPMPGTRLKLEAVPTMSQLDAENFLLTTYPDLPPLNCPVSHMGGAAGRPIVVNMKVGAISMPMPLTDATIQALFLKASPTQGAQAYSVYLALKTNTCAAIYNTAQLSSRYQKFLSYPAKWEDCKANGASISEWSKSQGFDFPGNHHRTAAVGGGVLFKCGQIYNGNADDALSYDSWFKWSDNNAVPLNIIQTLRASGDSPNSCPKACIPIIGGGGASASICVGLDPGIAAAGATIPLRLGAKFRAYDRDKELCTPVINVPAPFGIAQSLGEMADTAKQQAMQKMKDQIVAILPINKTMKANITKLQSAVK